MESVSVTHDNGTVDIFERVQMAATVAARDLEPLYWDEIRRLTLGLARFSSGSIRLVFVVPLLLFGPLVDGRREILGGLLTRRAGGTIAWQADGEQTSVVVEGFAPLLRGPLWRAQLAFHYLVGRRFVARVAREVR